MNREILQQVHDALINSSGALWNEYLSDWRHGIPTRRAQLDAKLKMCEDHDKAIDEIKAALAQPDATLIREGTMPDHIADAGKKVDHFADAGKPMQPEQEPSLQEQFDDALQSAAFYRRRVEALQNWQSKMRDPERTIVCDIIANGCTLDSSHAGDRYAAPPKAQPEQEPVAKVVSSGEYDFPMLQWLSANHSLDTAIGSLLYASPPQRQPLTDEFVHSVVRSKQPDLSTDSKAWKETLTECKYWLEAAHNIKAAP